MKRACFFVGDNGPQRLLEEDFPLTIGGAVCDIPLPGLIESRVVAYIAISSGHAYVQAANEQLELFHNHEFLKGSAWLKSGDRIQFEQQVICWDIKGDQVFIRVTPLDTEPQLTPPDAPPPDAPPPGAPPADATAEQDSEHHQDSVTSKTDEVDSEGAVKPASNSDSTSEPEAIIPIGVAPMSEKKRRRLRNLLISIFSILLLAALFVVLATPISVSVSPEPSDRSVSGFPPPVTLGGKKLVLPGSYTVTASLEGYYPLEQQIEVSSNGFQSFEFEMEELPGRVRIKVTPDVPVNVMLGDTALAVEDGHTVSLERGLKTLTILTDRYLEESREIDVAGYGALQELSISLRPAWADVSISSQPQAASVRVDGQEVGTTALQTEIIHGRRLIELSLDGYKPVRFEQSFEAGVPVTLDAIVLEPNDGTLQLQSGPAGATVSVDGTFRGTTPVSLVLTSGVPHQLELSKPGYLPVSQKVTVKPDEEQALTLTLPPEFGVVFASSKPADATLLIDGKPAGNGTQRLRLTTRPHTLTFSKPGYVTQTVSVTPRRQTSQNVDVVLKTQQQAKKDARPELLTTATGQKMPLIEPAGSFSMGASRREAGRRANESQRLVELTRAFYLSSREVTNAQYRQFNSKHTSGMAEGISLNGDSMPVVNISWDDAARYCNWLSEKDGLTPAYAEKDGKMRTVSTITNGYRMPTEAEWVYVARVYKREAQARYPWGEGYPPTRKVGNYADSQIADTLADVVTGYNDGYRGPAPVGSFDDMPAGFHDFGGNVAEWTNDYYAVYPGQVQRLVKDPTGPASGDHRVVRGSSWRDGSITELRLSYRDYSRGPRDNLGFRIARYADE